LLFGERPHSAATECDDTNRHAFAEQWNAEEGVDATYRYRFADRVLRIRGDIRDLDCVAFQYGTSDDRPPAWRNRMTLHERCKFRCADLRRGSVELTISAHDQRRIRFA